jgi:hypothetical protein
MRADSHDRRERVEQVWASSRSTWAPSRPHLRLPAPLRVPARRRHHPPPPRCRSQRPRPAAQWSSGRPRTKGDPLTKPPKLAEQVTNWTSVKVCVRGQMVERVVWSRTLLWYETARSRPLLLVIVRDPAGHQHDDYFITNDITLTPRRRSRPLFRSLGNRRRGDAPKEIREAVSDRGRVVRSRGERPPTRGVPNGQNPARRSLRP